MYSRKGMNGKMWKNTTHSKINIKPKQKTVVENKTLTQPPFRGVDYILPGGVGGWSENGPDISEVTYFTVLRVLSEALGKLPIHVRDKEHKIVKNSTEKLLTIRPNESMTPVQLFTYLEYSRNHYGNGYAYCKWSESTGELLSITALDPRCVRIWVDDVNDDILQRYYYTYTTMGGNSYILPAEDVVHVKNWHLDDQSRMVGLPVRETLHEYMNAAKAGQQTQNSLYKNGMISSGVLNYIGDLNDDKKELLLEQIKKIGTKNKIIPLPQGWELKTLNLSLADSQYLETRKFTSAQIAAAFGVNPNQLNDFSKASYANATAQQLEFLQSTLLYISRQYEDELTYKLLSTKDIEQGYHIDIDTEAVLQSTPDVLANILVKYVAGSIMTVNEARDKANLPPVEHGDKLMVMPGATTMNEVNETVEERVNV